MSATSAPASVVVRRLLASEAGGYRSIARWARRRPDVPTGAEPVGYSQISGPMMWLFVIGSAVEVVVVHVLLHRWPWVQWPVLVLGVWGLVFMLGLLAGVRTHPHLLTAHALRVRSGPVLDLGIPYAAIASVSTAERPLESSAQVVGTDAPSDGGPGTWLGVAVSGGTNVQLRLVRPLTVPHPGLRGTGDLEVVEVGLWADEPRVLARELRQRAGLGG
ncbi:hypothetical protein [Nocardioides zeae]|uniref:DUF304 domain-containing protein n=1 Tax=Nocardioides zeae TaxID=1457234 RepID=A0A6P0HIZ0_9ACTN|nr:hypothetical protein [Nocardioides zeae]NEN78571.1 hypothetical protein [Nocardioides zeae]